MDDWLKTNRYHRFTVNTEEFQNTSTNVITNEGELASHLQGYIITVTKLIRQIERANHHIQLLITAIERKKLPKGLIPKISPKIPDTLAWFIVT